MEEYELKKESKFDSIPAWLTAFGLFFSAARPGTDPYVERTVLDSIGSFMVNTGELLLLLALVLAGFVLLMRRRLGAVHIGGILIVAAAAVSSFVNRSGVSGAVKVGQLGFYLTALPLLFIYCQKRYRHYLMIGLGAALLLNMALAGYQAFFSGYGLGVFGLMGERISFCVLMVLGACILFPLLLDLEKSFITSALAVCIVAVPLSLISHGQILAVGVVCVFLAGLLHSRRGLLHALVALLFLGVTFFTWQGRENRLEQLSKTLWLSDSQGNYQAAHIELRAAFRMARDNRFGVGYGASDLPEFTRYQKNLMEHYRPDAERGREELRRPNVKSEPNNQGAWGIIAGTIGLGAVFIFALVMLWNVISCLISRFRKDEEGSRSAISGAFAAILALILLMLITDPLIRGLGPIFGLAFSLAFCSSSGFIYRQFSGLKLVLCGVVLGIFVVAPVFRRMPVVEVKDDSTEQNFEFDITSLGYGNRQEVEYDGFRIAFQMAEGEIFAPAELRQNEQGALVFVLPEGVGKPPENVAPSLEYGGARFVFEAEEQTQVKIFVYSRWDDSCGNSVFLKLNENQPIRFEDHIYERWHWVVGAGMHTVQKGKNELLILNREDGIQIAGILLIDDPNYIPRGLER